MGFRYCIFFPRQHPICCNINPYDSYDAVRGNGCRSNLVGIVLMIGIVLLAMGGSPWVLGLGIGLFAVTTAFAFITLPVEFDASARALKWLDRSHLMNYFDHGRAKSALFWAAMTYVVGALSSLAMLLYYVFIFLNARGRE